SEMPSSSLFTNFYFVAVVTSGNPLFLKISRQTPAVDVVAVGLSSGLIIIHNIKFDESLMKFQQDWGPVTSLSFRTDGHPAMVAGSPVGHIGLWDLEQKKLPLHITNGADRVGIRVWIFDTAGGGGRLLRSRLGHSAPPTKVQHHGSLLTVSQDGTLQSFSTVHERFNRSLGHGTIYFLFHGKMAVMDNEMLISILFVYMHKSLFPVFFIKINQLVTRFHQQEEIQKEKLEIWKFKSRKLVHSNDLGTSPASTHMHRDSGKLVIALDDFTLNVLDVETKRVVRKFPGHRGQVNDMVNGRWLIAAAMDCTIRTWDLPSGCLVDCFLVDSAAVSLTMSPTGDFLASSHVDSLGIYLWSNNTLCSMVSLCPLPSDYEPTVIMLPGTCPNQDEEGEEDDDLKSEQPVTLSLLPDSRWKNLLHLDIINDGCLWRKTFLAQKSAFFQQLESATLRNKYNGPVGMLKEMGPSGIDAELRGLAPDMGGDVSVLQDFLKIVASMLNSKRDFDLAQSYLALFLKLHLRLITQEPELMEEASRVSEKLEEMWTSMQTLFNQSLCLLSYTKSALL
uniref:WD repeat domain 36 n=1 Tax=Oncorhynchus kisutch TaxID=8019 RepID=A0A8C7DLY7_ONCKI